MADKAITDLNTIPGSVDDNNTWFAVAQSGTAYKVSGHEFVLALGTILDGHGGIKTIVYTPPVAPSLTGTMVITLADNSTVSVSVENGKGISSIAKTSTAGLVDTYTITYNDSTTSTFTVTNGAKGDTGDSWYVWIRYAGSMPTSDADIGTIPDDWIGIYSGTEDDPSNLHYTDFDWFEYKGEKGDTGDAATITTQNVSYQESSSGTVAPSGSWTTTIPSVTPGNFLWTRTQLAFNDGTAVTAYSVSRYGIDGTGAVSTVNNISPDGNGNIALTASDVPTSDNTSVQSHITGIESAIAGVTAATATPLMDGTAAVGTAVKYAREDHVHPTDTSRQETLVSGTNIKTVGGQSLLGSGNIDAGGALYYTSVACSAMTGNFATVSNAAITANHVVASVVFANSSAVTTKVAWTTANGSLTLNGTCASATTADIVLVLKNN